MDITVSFPGGLRVDARVGEHVVHTDQPVSAGGEGSAPTPFALFLASLATCAGIYLLGFLRQRGLDASRSGVRMTTETDPDSGLIREVTLELLLPPDFPEKYEAAVVRAVAQCTVKRHLERPPAFSTRVTRLAQG